MTFEPLRISSKDPAARFSPRSASTLAHESPHDAYERGRSEAQEESARALNAAFEALAQAARAVKGQAQSAERLAVKKAAELIARVIVEAAPTITLVAAVEAIGAVLEKRGFASDAGTIVVRAHPDTVAALRERLGGEIGNEDFSFEEDPALGPARVVARWQDGSVECDLENAARGIAEFVNETHRRNDQES